ncbi:RNA-binding S4 domain-containing protein [Cypionkella aquatica]|uniref:RNA-binding S4 domain-containing protein n=1 Tax=Cypionkella aquatica TaxID=1756042 RepID=UPI0024E09B2F|nr:RNA-binding S4 domain-containing protein [Cypionkella aquatica]
MAGPGAKPAKDVQPKLRLDKWLFAARFFKNRELASEVIESGHLRLNGQRCKKPGHAVMAGDTLTFPQGRAIRVIRVLALSDRRGPAEEAQQLYHDLAPTADAPLE